MEQALIGVLALAVGIAVGYAARTRMAANRLSGAEHEAERVLTDARSQAESQLKEARVQAREELLQQRAEQERELAERRAEVVKVEERVITKEEQLQASLEELARRDQSVADRETHARQMQEDLKTVKEQQVAELERIAGLTQTQARDALMSQTEEQSRHDMAKLVRQIEEEAKVEADRRARNILSVAIQRTASSATPPRPRSRWSSCRRDDLKGRIIGREGRNIRALENLTGVDVIIDDTPQAVVLSGVRRRPPGDRQADARQADRRRADPSRRGSRRCTTSRRRRSRRRSSATASRRRFEANVHGLHPELIKMLGRLHYRTSYGQNVLKHSIECAHLAAIMAAELGASQKTARRAALLHDIGKAVTHEVEGSHAVISAEMARKFRESPSVSHAIEAHHYDVEPQTVEAVLVIAADAISASRPGGRGEALEHYIKRLEELEQIATSKRGRRALLRDAGRPRDPRDGQARGGRRSTPPRCSATRSLGRSRPSSSTRARSR